METTVQEIIRLLGGFDNISTYTHCATRLRVQLKDASSVEKETLEKVSGVLGVVNQGSTIQVIIGPKVDEAYRIMQEAEKAERGAVTSAGGEVEDEAAEKEDKKFSFNDILTYISASIAPVLPVLVAAGLISAVLAILTQFNLLSSEASTYVILSAVSDAAFTYLPVLVAVAAAKKLNTNPYIAGYLAVAMTVETISGVMITTSRNGLRIKVAACGICFEKNLSSSARTGTIRRTGIILEV